MVYIHFCLVIKLLAIFDLYFFKGIWLHIFLLFHLEELLKLYVNLLYRFCVALLFLRYFGRKKITNQRAFRHLGFWRISMLRHKQGQASILSTEQLVCCNPALDVTKITANEINIYPKWRTCS